MPGTLRIARQLAIGLSLFTASAGTASGAGLACSGVDLLSVLGSAPVYDRSSASIVRLQFPESGSCTGTLVNNVLGDGRPLILTARHCLGVDDARLNDRNANIEVIYTRRSCLLGSCVLNRYLTTRGASVRMAWGDLMLLEAWDSPPNDAEPYFAGLSLQEPESSGFGLHYSVASTLQWVSQRYDGNSRSFVLSSGERGHPPLGVTAWETTLQEGATPAGASGSALMGRDGHIHGVLSTGNSCGKEHSTNLYQKVSDAWIGGGTPATSLRYWIDPAEVGAVVVDGEWASKMADAPAPPSIIVNAFDGDQGGTDGASSGGGGGAGWGLLLLVAAAVRGLSRALRGATSDRSA